LCNCPYFEAQFLVCPYFLNFARLPLLLQDESTVCPSFLHPLVVETFRPKKRLRKNKKGKKTRMPLILSFPSLPLANESRLLTAAARVLAWRFAGAGGEPQEAQEAGKLTRRPSAASRRGLARAHGAATRRPSAASRGQRAHGAAWNRALQEEAGSHPRAGTGACRNRAAATWSRLGKFLGLHRFCVHATRSGCRMSIEFPCYGL